MTTILLADDHAVLRSGLKLLLENQPDLKVVGEASSGMEAIELAGKLQPDLLLLDLPMPGLGGLDALPALRKIIQAAKILILTMHDDPQYLRTALKSGASGYVLKKAVDVELISAIRAVLRGDMYIHPSMTRVLPASYWMICFHAPKINRMSRIPCQPANKMFCGWWRLATPAPKLPKC